MPQKLYRRLRKRIYPYVSLENGVLLLAVVIAGSLLWNTMVALQLNFAYEQEVQLLEQQVELTELETQSLELSKLYYASPEYQELSARERLGKALPGENLVILPDYDDLPPDETGDVPATPASLARERTNFEQWLYFFFGESRRD